MNFEDILKTFVKDSSDVFFLTVAMYMLDSETEIAYLKSKLPEGTPPYSKDVITPELVEIASNNALIELRKIEQIVNSGVPKKE